MDSFVGEEEYVLFEEEIEIDNIKYYIGHNERYVKIAVLASGKECLKNEIRQVRITSKLSKAILLSEILE